MGKLQWSLLLDRALAEQGCDNDDHDGDGDGDDVDGDGSGDEDDVDNDGKLYFSAPSSWPRKGRM